MCESACHFLTGSRVMAPRWRYNLSHLDKHCLQQQTASFSSLGNIHAVKSHFPKGADFLYRHVGDGREVGCGCSLGRFWCAAPPCAGQPALTTALLPRGPEDLLMSGISFDSALFQILEAPRTLYLQLVLKPLSKKQVFYTIMTTRTFLKEL